MSDPPVRARLEALAFVTRELVIDLPHRQHPHLGRLDHSDRPVVRIDDHAALADFGKLVFAQMTVGL